METQLILEFDGDLIIFTQLNLSIIALHDLEDFQKIKNLIFLFPFRTLKISNFLNSLEILIIIRFILKY